MNRAAARAAVFNEPCLPLWPRVSAIGACPGQDVPRREKPSPTKLYKKTVDFGFDSSKKSPIMSVELEPEEISIFEDRLWHHKGWEARVIKNEDDDGWAVSMTQDGQAEPALVGPWTMGRDKKSPKPLDVSAFNTLVKTASEVIRRNEQHQAAMLHKAIEIEVRAARVTVALDIEPDEENPSATLTATAADGSELAKIRVRPDHSLTRASAQRWAESGYPREREE